MVTVSRIAGLTLATVNSHSFHSFQQEILLDVCMRDSVSTLSTGLIARSALTVDFVLVVTENDDGRGRLLQTFEKVQHLGLLLHVFDLLDDLEKEGSDT